MDKNQERLLDAIEILLAGVYGEKWSHSFEVGDDGMSIYIETWNKNTSPAGDQ